MPGLVTFLVPDYDEGLRFFVDGLGWRCLEDRDEGRKRWVVVAPPEGAGGASLVLARPSSPAQEAAMGAQAGDRVAFFLSSRDFDGDAERIVLAGGRFLETPRDEAYGRVAQWRDPWGNRWDLLQAAD
ncbi:VOC family protein [Roseibacterium sp. SDUM158017]|uniref:VOC family protein n=1 Tax=Roseicyclus salinarum TaxID=3036773 RepID=UPI00241510F0|nr:VOC family protein [Roseibacterium sp. SDUM158017]MDG4647575.1 VOC family protein [Roseibacterium sp. SDUM158017]